MLKKEFFAESKIECFCVFFAIVTVVIMLWSASSKYDADVYIYTNFTTIRTELSKHGITFCYVYLYNEGIPLTIYKVSMYKGNKPINYIEPTKMKRLLLKLTTGKYTVEEIFNEYNSIAISFPVKRKKEFILKERLPNGLQI